MTLTLSLFALLVSGTALALLGVADPKRRRVRGLGGGGYARKLCVAVALLPGAALIAAGAWASLLIWVGGCTVLGWAIAALLAPPRAAA